ncbi:MAG: hypothetical protein IKI93_18300 [Clostridia bacterium]|nr:hypothetical protein [Clostridia bacterium]
MTPSEYIVIKLPGNWIEREQMKVRIKALLDAEVLDERNIVTYRCRQMIDEERYRGEAAIKFEDYIKDEMAVRLGRNLLSEGLFRISKERNRFGTTLEGKILIINEKPEEGESYVEIHRR